MDKSLSTGKEGKHLDVRTENDILRGCNKDNSKKDSYGVDMPLKDFDNMCMMPASIKTGFPEAYFVFSGIACRTGGTRKRISEGILGRKWDQRGGDRIV